MRHLLTPIVLMFLLTACGGSSNVRIEGTRLPGINFNSVLMSDALVSGHGESERISDVSCTPDGTECRMTFQGVTYTVPQRTDPRASATLYTTLGEWEHMRAAAIHYGIEGYRLRYAVAGGHVYPNSIPRGSATWTGDMVALDRNNRLVRGGARIELHDFADTTVDVVLSPQGHAAMRWHLSVVDGGFSYKSATSSYIKGEFYGPGAEEVGGVFERNRLVGAFGAKR